MMTPPSSRAIGPSALRSGSGYATRNGGILLTKHRDLLIPILVYCEGELDLLPEMPASEKRQRHATAHEQIARAVAATRAICNPYRAAEARRQPSKARRSTRIRR